VVADVNPQNLAAAYLYRDSNAGTQRGSAALTGKMYFYDGATLLHSTAVALSGGSYTAAYATTTLTTGSHTITTLYGETATMLLPAER